MALSGALAGRSLYLCTPDRPDLEDFVLACVEGGVDIVQLREKHLEARELLGRAAIVKKVCNDAGVPFIMNDRPDLALACGADGVHVGQDDVDPAICRAILGEAAIVGLSTHHPDELEGIDRRPVDYFAAGPVVHTATHPDRVPTGIGYVRTASRIAAGDGTTRSLPLFITGGVTPDAVDELAAAGARAFVVVRYLTESSDPRAAAQALRRSIDQAIERYAA